MTMTEREQTPRTHVSDESNEEQLHLAHEQGHTLGKAVKHMTQIEAHGEERVVGDYLIGYAVENAEGMYHWQGDELVWRNPTDENAHVEVVVRDAADGRFIPGLNVIATLSDSAGKVIGTHIQPFLWHPWLFHYGRNWTLPGDGSYTLSIQVEAPSFMRHDKVNGKRFAKAVTVEFADIQIKTGQKKS